MDGKTNEDHLHLFKCRENTIITTTGTVRQDNIKEYFDDKVKNKSFPEHAKVTVICGYHGLKDGSAGGPFDEFNRQVKTALEDVEENNQDICESMNYDLSGDIQSISKRVNKALKSSVKITIDKMF